MNQFRGYPWNSPARSFNSINIISQFYLWCHQWAWRSENFYINTIRVMQRIFGLNFRFSSHFLLDKLEAIFMQTWSCRKCQLQMCITKAFHFREVLKSKLLTKLEATGKMDKILSLQVPLWYSDIKVASFFKNWDSFLVVNG